MNKVKTVSMTLTILICIVIIGIFTPRVTNAIKIDYTDPRDMITIDSSIEEGIPLSVYGKNFKEGDIIYINDYPQNTAYGNDEWMTCYIDIPNLRKDQILKIYVKRENSYYKSNNIRIRTK